MTRLDESRGMVDARYEKVRVDHRIVDMAVLIALGVNEDGRREVLGVAVVHGETKASWGEFLGSLVERGLEGVRLIASDAHAGLADARREHFPGVPWQRCQRHFLEKHRLRMRTTNGIERVNQEIKRRTRVVRIFPDRRSCLRLATALLKECHEDWTTGRRYLRMELLVEWRSGGSGQTEGPLETAA